MDSKTHHLSTDKHAIDDVYSIRSHFFGCLKVKERADFFKLDNPLWERLVEQNKQRQGDCPQIDESLLRKTVRDKAASNLLDDLKRIHRIREELRTRAYPGSINETPTISKQPAAQGNKPATNGSAAVAAAASVITPDTTEEKPSNLVDLVERNRNHWKRVAKARNPDEARKPEIAARPVQEVSNLAPLKIVVLLADAKVC